MIDSAQTIPVQAALSASRAIPPGATLTPVNPALDLDISRFAIRDGELSYRDLVVSVSMLQVALKASTVWTFPISHPRVASVAQSSLFYNNLGDRVSSPTGSVAHVLNSSIPIDAVITDKQLYNRDVVLLEVIARTAKIFEQATVSQLDPTLDLGPCWSKGSGVSSSKGIGYAEKLSTELFSEPDKNLADQDNQIAAYVSRLVAVLTNPFEYANRIFVEISGDDPREGDTYVLGLEDSNQRIWFAEPALSGRMRIIYDRVQKTLQWVPESSNQIHIPRPAPAMINTGGTLATNFSIQGLTGSQLITTRRTTPSAKDAQFWRQKSQRLIFSGVLEQDGSTVVAPAGAVVDGGGVNQYDAASLLIPGVITFRLLTGSLNAGSYRVSALIKPDHVVNLPGGQNSNSVVYNDGGAGNGGANYPGGGGSTSWSFALPAGGWNLVVEYTSSSATTGTISGIASGGIAIALAASLTQTSMISFAATGANQAFTLTVAGVASFHVRRLIITAADTTSRLDYAIKADLLNGSFSGVGASQEKATIGGARQRSDVVTFLFKPNTTVVNPSLRFQYSSPTQGAPLKILQLHIQDAETPTPTPSTSGYEYWKREMLDRAEAGLCGQYLDLMVGQLLAPTTPPPADDFSDRSAISFISAATLFGTNATFSKEVNEPDHGGNPGGKSGWWKWVAPSSGLVTLSTAQVSGTGISSSGTGFNALLGVYTGSSVDALSPVVPGTGSGTLTFTAVAGTEYQIVVDGVDGSFGAIAVKISSAAPSNNLFSTAQVVLGFTRGLGCVTTGATKEVGEPNHAGDPGGKSAWWSLTAPITGRIVVDATRSLFSTVVGVYTGVAVNALAPVASSASGKVEFDAVLGTVYQIAVDGVAGANGAIILDIQPEFRLLDSGVYYWTTSGMALWLSVLEAKDARLRSAFRLAGPGDVGKPALVPRGLEFRKADGRIQGNQAAVNSIPTICALQPWMLELGSYVAKREFWPAEADFS
jgi:hypothetical protein